MKKSSIERSLTWSGWPVNAAARFAVKAPRWVPFLIRRAPLRLLGLIVGLQVRLLLLIGVSGS